MTNSGVFPVFIEWPEILVMVYQLWPFSTTFLSPGEVLWCTELQVSLPHRRWGGPFPSDSQNPQDSWSLQAEFRLPCLIFVPNYFYSCNPLRQVSWFWSVLSLHPQILPSGIKPSTQKHALNFQLPYGYMQLVFVSSWGGTYSAKGSCNSGLFAKGFLGLEAFWSSQGVPEDSASVL